jgi:hypothetical protein
MIVNFFALRDGLPLLKINMDSQHDLSDNKKQFMLLSGFFQAITSFTDSVDKLGEIDEVQMTDQIFSFWRKKYKHSVILFIICSDENTGKPFRQAILEEASATFLHMYKKELQEKWTGETHQFQAFEPVFRDIVKATSEILDMHSDELEEISSDKTIVIQSSEPNSVQKSSEEILYERPAPIPIPITQAPSKPPALISPRFERYQTLQQYQKRINGALTRRSQLNPSYHPLQIQNTAREYGFTSQNTGFAPYFAPPVPPQTRGFGFAAVYPNGQISNRTPLSHHRFSPTSFTAPKIATEALFTDLNHLQGSHRIHTSAFELIPSRKQLTAGAFRTSIQDGWQRVLFVAIDGNKTVTQLAQQLEKTPQEILKMCQKFTSQKLVEFKR